MTLGGLDASQAGATHGLDGGLADVEVQIPEGNFNKVYLKSSTLASWSFEFN